MVSLVRACERERIRLCLHPKFKARGITYQYPDHSNDRRHFAFGRHIALLAWACFYTRCTGWQISLPQPITVLLAIVWVLGIVYSLRWAISSLNSSRNAGPKVEPILFAGPALLMLTGVSITDFET